MDIFTLSPACVVTIYSYCFYYVADKLDNLRPESSCWDGNWRNNHWQQDGGCSIAPELFEELGLGNSKQERLRMGHCAVEWLNIKEKDERNEQKKEVSYMCGKAEVQVHWLLPRAVLQ